jgi:hypothetical protein
LQQCPRQMKQWIKVDRLTPLPDRVPPDRRSTVVARGSAWTSPRNSGSAAHPFSEYVRATAARAEGRQRNDAIGVSSSEVATEDKSRPRDCHRRDSRAEWYHRCTDYYDALDIARRLLCWRGQGSTAGPPRSCPPHVYCHHPAEANEGNVREGRRHADKGGRELDPLRRVDQ